MKDVDVKMSNRSGKVEVLRGDQMSRHVFFLRPKNVQAALWNHVHQICIAFLCSLNCSYVHPPCLSATLPPPVFPNALNKVINLEEDEGKFSTEKMKTSCGNDYWMGSVVFSDVSLPPEDRFQLWLRMMESVHVMVLLFNISAAFHKRLVNATLLENTYRTC